MCSQASMDECMLIRAQFVNCMFYCSNSWHADDPKLDLHVPNFICGCGVCPSSKSDCFL